MRATDPIETPWRKLSAPDLIALQQLDLSNNPRLTDLSALVSMPPLQSIDLRSCSALPERLQRRWRSPSQLVAQIGR